MYVWKSLAIVLALFAFIPAAASAQGTLAGTVRDTSGAVLPGVTVEAASPVLLEKVRTTVTDGSGLFRFSELPPGPYSLSFSLQGFSTVRREGIELTGLQVAAVDAEMRLGDISETIVVTGEAPIVDVQSARRGQVLQDEALMALPATRGYNAIVLLVPSVTGMTNQIDLAPSMRNFASHGGRSQEGRVTLDGLNTGAGFNTGGVSFYMLDTGGAQEMNVTLSGGLGEAEVGGPTVNLVPKTGGNAFSGQLFASGSGKWSQGDNLDSGLRDYGFTEVAASKSWDASASVGGPIIRDRLWFFGTARDVGAHIGILGMYANQNAGDATTWRYDRDSRVRAAEATAKQVAALRLTAQVTPRHKIGLYYDYQFTCNGSALIEDAGVCRSRGSEWIGTGSATASPEASTGPATTGYLDSYQRMTQATWSAPMNNNLLFDAAYSGFFNRYGPQLPPGSILNLNQVTEQRSLQNSDGTFAPANLTYRAQDAYASNSLWNQNWRASASYVTGAHEMKFGYQGVRYAWHRNLQYNDTRVNYTFNDTRPVSLLMNIGSWKIATVTGWHALYAQEQWRVGRLSLQGAVRYDRASSFAPAEGNGWDGPDRFHAQPITFPYTPGVDAYHDITPRFGAAFDVFGTGKTSLKVNAGKYLRAAANDPPYIATNPALNFQRTTARAWNDVNSNYVPDCDLMNATLNGECGPWLSPAFGNPIVPVTINPDVLHGWGVREYDWKVGAAVQHELVSGTSIELEYNRRLYRNFLVIDNRAVAPQDFDRFTVLAPMHDQLSGGGGYPLTYVDPRSLRQDSYLTFETDYASPRTQYWHGVGASVNMRPRGGLALQGGVNAGRGVWDYCSLVTALPELTLPLGLAPPPGAPPSVAREPLEGCSGAEPFLADFRGTASYMIPKLDVLVSAAIQNKPGTLGNVVGVRDAASNGMWMQANVFTPNSLIAQSLGRLPTGQTSPAGTTTLNALQPSEMYGDRVNQVDVRFAKNLRFGRTTTLVGIDVYNLLNTNAALTYNQAFAANWPRPTSILLSRLLRLNATVSF